MNAPSRPLLMACLLCLGCAREASPTPSNEPPRPSAATPGRELDELDKRAPVPLLPMMANHQKQNMRDHLVAVQEIVGGLAASDFGAVETAARRLGFSNQMGQMCEHMGSRAPGFSAQAIDFHHTADRVVAAAQSRDSAAVMRELDATLRACTTCHATWKQQVVDERVWNEPER